MGRRAKITYEQVVTAEKALQAHGVFPTADTIRGLLGEGSLSTIQKFLEVIREKQSAAKKRDPVVLPPALVSELEGLVYEYADRALAPEETRARKQSAEIRVLIAESEAVQRRLEVAERQYERLNTKVVHHMARARELSKELAEERKKHDAWRARAHVAEEQLKNTKTALDAANTQIKVSQESHSVVTSALEEERLRNAQLLGRLGQLEQQLSDCRAEIVATRGGRAV